MKKVNMPAKGKNNGYLMAFSDEIMIGLLS